VTNHTNQKSLRLRVTEARVLIASLILMGIVSSCSSTSTSPSDSGALPASQSAAPSNSAPAATSNTGAVSSAAPAPAITAPAQEHLIGVGSETVVTVHGKVVSVNRAKKLVTLEGPDGKQVTIHVYNPYNLAAAKAGLPFVAKFYEIVTVRKLLAGESLPAASVAEGIIGAVPGQTPGAAAGTRIQIVVTINAINMDKKTIEVKGPDGSLETVSVANSVSLKHVKVGEKIVVTSTNVVAIALEADSPA
jgi:hypothetical protein